MHNAYGYIFSAVLNFLVMSVYTDIDQKMRIIDFFKPQVDKKRKSFH